MNIIVIFEFGVLMQQLLFKLIKTKKNRNKHFIRTTSKFNRCNFYHFNWMKSKCMEQPQKNATDQFHVAGTNGEIHRND